MRKAAGTATAAVADLEGGARRVGPSALDDDKTYRGGGGASVLCGHRVPPRALFLAGVALALFVAFVVVPKLTENGGGDGGDSPEPSHGAAAVAAVADAKGDTAAARGHGAEMGARAGAGAGGRRPGRGASGGSLSRGGGIGRARRNEMLALLTSADGEFNEAEDDNAEAAARAAASAARRMGRDDKPARLGQETPTSKVTAQAIRDGTAEGYVFANQTLMRLLMEGITMPRDGQWREANVKSLLVYHPAAAFHRYASANTGLLSQSVDASSAHSQSTAAVVRESWTDAGRAAAATAEKLFSRDGANTLLNTGCLPDKDYAVRRRTCAVVGNGGVNLLDPHQGRAIDDADVVIRFNDGPTTSFERFVGKKTTFRLINNQWSRHVADRGAVGTWAEAGGSPLRIQVSEFRLRVEGSGLRV
jgi:hypothetical protein